MEQNSHSFVWVDLSDLLVWRGHFTGIQRVTYEYAKRFEQDGARFCAFDKIDNRFFELELGFLERVNIEGSTGDSQPSVISTRRKIRRAIGKPYYILSEESKTLLRPVVTMTNFYVRYGLSKFDQRDKSKKSPFHARPEVVFNENDTLVMMGASWNDQAILDFVVQLKLETGFTLVQHINDILPIYQPQLFSEELPGKFKPYVNKVIHYADLITVISEATKRDLQTYCKENNITDIRIEAVRLGEDVEIDKPLRPEAVRADEQFILAVGTFEVRKNYILLYQAVKLAQLEGHEIPKIIIAGRKGWLTDDLAHTLRLDPFARERILWLSDVSDSELSWLYENCMFSVFPSLAEGWGLPIVESLNYGKMALASGTSSMLEIGDGLVDYFLPYDARECLEKIRYYVSEDRATKKNEQVKRTYKVFTWDQSYNQLSMVISGTGSPL
ncbi:MAG: glycosyltransferase family 1 protein [Candidatus Saccharimonadales bacterium]